MQLSILEYRQRKQQPISIHPELDNAEVSSLKKNARKNESDNICSGASSFSSDEENIIKTSLIVSSVGVQLESNYLQNDEKKGNVYLNFLNIFFYYY